MKKRTLSLGMAALLAMGLAACSSNASTPAANGSSDGTASGSNVSAESTGNSNAELKKVTVILDYVPNTNHTGLYAALDLGYFAEQGLEVEIIEPTEDTTEVLVAAEKGDFGVSYQENVTFALTSDSPLPITAIAALIQHNTSGFVWSSNSDIKSVADWEGKTYVGWGGAGENAVVEGVMTENGLDFSKLSIVSTGMSDYSELEGDADIMWFFEAWDCIFCRRAGVDIQYVACRDLDERLDYYTPILIANNSLLENDPDTARAFLAACEKGYQYCINDPDAAADIIYKYAPDYDYDALKESQNYLADKYIDDADAWGVMKDSVWDNYTAFLVEYGVLDEAIPASDCYTNEFLPQ